MEVNPSPKFQLHAEMELLATKVELSVKWIGTPLHAGASLAKSALIVDKLII